MTPLTFVCIAGALVCLFLGKAAIAAAASHVETAHPGEFKRLSRFGLLPIKGLSGDADRVRRGLAGPLLTGFLHKDLRGDPVIKAAQTQWRMAFSGMILSMILAMFTLGPG
ncbi:MAG: hypothetical protein AAGF44_10550 [Pseudomonadota bacterium]